MPRGIVSFAVLPHPEINSKGLIDSPPSASYSNMVSMRLLADESKIGNISDSFFKSLLAEGADDEGVF